MNDTANSTAAVDNVSLSEALFYVVNGSVGSLFNIVVLYIAFRFIDTDDKPRQIIVINMTVADLLMCIVYMLTRPILIDFPVFLCRPYYIAIWTVQLCSCMNLVWLNLDKLIYIQFPLHYYSIVSRNRLHILSAFTWICLTIIAIVTNYFMSVGDNCIAVRVNFVTYLPVCIMYAVMILASFIISAIIYVIAHSSTNMEARQRSRLLQRLFFLFSSTLWTFFTALPYRVLFIRYTLCRISDKCDSSPIIDDLTHISFKMLVVGTVINPIITIATQRIYRARLLKMFSKWKERRISEDTAASVSTRRASSKGTCIENVALTSHL